MKPLGTHGHRGRRRDRLPATARSQRRARVLQRDGTGGHRRARARPPRQRQVRRRSPLTLARGAHAVRSDVPRRPRDATDPPDGHHVGRRHPPRDPDRQPVGPRVEPARHGGGARGSTACRAPPRSASTACRPGMAQLFGTLAPNADLVDGEQLMRGVRAAKLPAEIDCIRVALAIAEGAMTETTSGPRSRCHRVRS